MTLTASVLLAAVTAGQPSEPPSVRDSEVIGRWVGQDDLAQPIVFEKGGKFQCGTRCKNGEWVTMATGTYTMSADGKIRAWASDTERPQVVQVMTLYYKNGVITDELPGFPNQKVTTWKQEKK
jgi:hypothetical protein